MKESHREYVPRVSVGLPVYNGEPFLTEAIDSILNQTFEDFELIISDNASSDRTEEICQSYAAKDRRVTYHRNEKNLGAARNFNWVFEKSSGEYFKWAAHDDLLRPDYLAMCVEVLDQDPSVVLCYPRARVIDENGMVLADYDVKLNTDSPRPQDRYYDLIGVLNRCYEVFGLIRSNDLRMTSRIGNYAVSDRVLLAELGLRGRFYEIPERLFSPRSHPGKFTRTCPDRDSQTVWFDPKKEGRIILPRWRVGLGYLAALGSAPLSWSDRLNCGIVLAGWFLGNRGRLVGDLTGAGKQVLRRSSLIDRLVVAAKRTRSVSE
jgi:glycosyltransferase involved in cell wall biosynthesis